MDWDRAAAANPVATLLNRGGIGKHAIDANRIGNVLDLAIAERLVSANQLVLDLLVDAAGNVDFASLSYALESRRNIDAVAIDIVGFDDDVAEIDADPIFDPVMLGQRCVAADQVLLDHDAGAHGLDGAIEDGDEAVTRGFDEPAVVLSDGGLDEVALEPLDAVVRPFLIDLHQAAVAGDVACHDGGKTPRHWLAWLLTTAARLDVTNLGHGSD